ncbi:MAG: hypothetical protein IJ060_04540 [Oscillospiraceae bacterium]|nr:hypothetical protein [Oscillospiraceae bacterium]
MIINALLRVVLVLLGILFAPLSLVALPASVSSIFLGAVGWLINGFRIIAVYTDLSYLLVLFGIVAAFDAVLWLYKIIMWILRKIPFLNIK